TATAFALSFAIGWLFRRHMAEATIAGLSGAYGNIGYMGPALALATLGAAANVPVALIFCFDTLVLFALVPFLMTLAAPRHEGIAATAFEVGKRIVLHPFIIATALGVASAAVHFEPPVALDRLMLFLLGPFNPTWVYTAVLMAALPPALNVFIMARQYDTWVAQASGSVLFGTFVSVATLTTTMWLVKTGTLPTTLLR